MTIKTFKTLSEIGRGRLLFQTESDETSEELYRATTNEYVLCRGDEEILLPNSKEALDWALKQKLCSDRHQFLENCVELIRIPYGSVTPKIRIYSEGLDVLDYGFNAILRSQELVQHPAFNHCIIKHTNGEDRVTLTPALRTQVVRMVRQIYETDYYMGCPVNFADHTRIQYAGDDSYLENFNLIDGHRSCPVECFSVYRGADLPFDFRTRTCDETTWVRVPETYEIWNDEFITKLASVAIAVCIHYQINDAMIDGFDEHPLALHGLGRTELQQG